MDDRDNRIIDENDVGKMDIDAAFDWLEEKNISHQLHSLDEMRTLIRLTLHANASGSSAGKESSQSNVSESDLIEVLSRDKEMRDQIGSLYEELLKTINTNWTGLNEYVSTWCGCKIERQLNKHKDELQHMDCPIVIAGETSAGKSCFLNLLLGEDVLPVSLLSATSTICVIHPIPPGEKPYFEVDGEKHEGNKTELKGQLKTKLTSRSKTVQIKQVDIYWQMPLVGLNKHIVFVDTPGIGENEQMSDKVFEYLPNAAAFIYVINCANAGGVQEDKLVQIFKKVLEYDNSSSLFSFDPACTLFVCNKWDVVVGRVRQEECTEQNVVDDISSHLCKYLPGISRDKFIYKMSTTEALRYMKSGMGDSTYYAELKKGLKHLVIQGQTSKSRMHYRWFVHVLRQIDTFVSSKKQHANASIDEKMQLRKQVDTKLKNIEENKNKVRDKLMMKCKELSDDMGLAIHAHLTKEEVKGRIHANVQELLHVIRAPDDDAFQYTAKHRIMEIVVKEIDAWEKAGQHWRQTVEYFTHEIEREFRSLDEECREAEAAIDNIERLPYASVRIAATKMQSWTYYLKDKWDNAVSPWLMNWGFKLGAFEFSMRSVITKIHHFGKLLNRDKYMRKLLKVVMQECFSEESVRHHISEIYFVPIEHKIQEQCDHRISTRIRSCKGLLDSIVHDSRNADEIISECKKMDENVQFIYQNMDKVRVKAQFKG